MYASKYANKLSEFISYHEKYFFKYDIIIQDTVALINKYGAFNLSNCYFSEHEISSTKTQTKKGVFYTFFYEADILLSLEMLAGSQINIKYLVLFMHMFLNLNLTLKDSEKKAYALINSI